MVEIRLLQAGDEDILARVAPEVFDHAVDPVSARTFLAEPHHHIAVALDAGILVGFASGMDYVHPDKPREMFVNEVGVAPTHLRRGIGKMVVAALLDRARTLGCVNGWVLTDADNAAARALYSAAGGKAMEQQQLCYEFSTR